LNRAIYWDRLECIAIDLIKSKKEKCVVVARCFNGFAGRR
jgi:hypothetical protein